ncbi:MAG TPA: FlgD immunoglobulin-like domain containing protein [Nitrososphaera sp.]
MAEKMQWELGSQVMASLAAKAVLAVAVLLSGTLLLQAAQAQQPPRQKFTVSLSETLAASDSVSKGLSLKKSVADSVAAKDAASKGVEKPIPKSIAAKVTIKDSIRKTFVPGVHEVSRSVFEQVAVKDMAKGPSMAAIAESLKVDELPLLSGSVVPPAAPQLSVPEGQKMLTFHSDRNDSVTIAFLSSSAGTYKIDIKNVKGDTVATFAGAMAQGENQVKWTGADSQGKAAPSGTYTYYITARNDSGTRSAPSGGDGKIVVAGADAETPAAPGRLDLTQIPFMELLPIALPVVAVGGVVAFLVSKKRNKKLVLYLPPDAAPVIEDIREKYPGATVEDFMGHGEQGSSRYMGVIIDSKESNDDWLSGIIAKAKQLAGVDSISLSYRGKMRSV